MHRRHAPATPLAVSLPTARSVPAWIPSARTRAARTASIRIASARTAAALITGALCTAASSSLGSIPLDPHAGYESLPLSHYATGGLFVDLDADGWIDMVTANGNDIGRQKVTVYRHDGTSIPTTPTWQSTDIDYNGHLDVGDVDGDGISDLVVSVYIGPAGFSQPGNVKLYLGAGDGTFTSSPVWVSDPFYTFSCALGDADGDGDLDLAVACGDDYENNAERQRIFFNVDGSFAAVTPWQSDDVAYALDVVWEDVDLDGDLDVVFCGSSSPLRIYENHQTEGGGISTSATWQNTDLPELGNTAAMGDWNGDGFPELAVADNNQLGGAGKFKVYENAGGTLPTTPTWTSATGGYGSHVSWVDIDTDGDLDLAAGIWFGQARIFENLGGTLTTTPVWLSDLNVVTENMFWGDVDNDGLRHDGVAHGTGDGLRTFFRTGQTPVRSIDAVSVGGSPVGPDAYCEHLSNGWISFANPPAPGDEVQIEYSYSVDLDLGITTWDSSIGNLIHFNLRDASEVPSADLALDDLRAIPNPVRNGTRIRYRGPALGAATLDVFDVSGRVVRSVWNGEVAEGLATWEWDRRDGSGRKVPSGVYYVRLSTTSGGRALPITLID
ncbi:MAG: FG-GAP-like repeat-containing protein [Candidatus Eisenbacteria bacterium]